MINFLSAIILASLLFPSGLPIGQAGFNFLMEKTADYSDSIEAQSDAPQRFLNKSLGIKTTAKSILIVDEKSNTVLYDKNSQAVLPIASITKLMTALVFLEHNPGWDENLTLTDEDKREGGFIYLFTDEEVTIKDLFYLSLISSSNEATAALVRSTGLDNFIAIMNQKAFDLGMINTYFAEPTGLDPGNISSPTDLIKLAQATFSQPEILKALAIEEYTFNVLNNQRLVKATNTNKLLNSFINNGSYQIIGAKTGYLDEAGYCLLIKIKKSEDQELILVLLGVEDKVSRWQETKGLIEWVFENYQWPG